MRCIWASYSLVSSAAVPADAGQLLAENFFHRRFGDLQEERASHALPGQTIARGLQPPVLLVLAKTRYRVRGRALVAALQPMQPPDRVLVSMDGGSCTGDTQAVGVEPRVVEPRGDVQFALDIMLSAPEKMPVGSRVAVGLP